MHRLGDPVEVKLVEAAPLAGALRFELLSEGRPLPGKARRETARKAATRGRNGAAARHGKSRGKAPKASRRR